MRCCNPCVNVAADAGDAAAGVPWPPCVPPPPAAAAVGVPAGAAAAAVGVAGCADVAAVSAGLCRATSAQARRQQQDSRNTVNTCCTTLGGSKI